MGCASLRKSQHKTENQHPIKLVLIRPRLNYHNLGLFRIAEECSVLEESMSLLKLDTKPHSGEI